LKAAHKNRKGVIQMRNNRFFVAGVLALTLIFGFALLGCNTGTGGGGSSDTPPPGGGAEYELGWGYWEGTNYATVSGNFASNSLPLTPAGDKAGYLTGAKAGEAYDAIENNLKTYPFDDKGELEGSFEELLNFKNDGKGFSDDLKVALKAQKANVPIAGALEFATGGGPIVVVFFIDKKSKK
jgi:hypothetical protein